MTQDQTQAIYTPDMPDYRWVENKTDIRIGFPKIRRWDEIVESAEFIDILRSPELSKRWPTIGTQTGPIFCTVEHRMSPFSAWRHRSGVVELNPRIQGWIWGQITWMVQHHHEPIRASLKVVDWGDGRALVIATDSLIWSNYWVALIATDSIPLPAHGASDGGPVD